MIVVRRPCAHPHRSQHTEWLQTVPRTPVSPFQVVFWGTEVGELPYCGVDNLRGLEASQSLTARMQAARLVQGAHRVPIDSLEYDYLDPKWPLPHLALSGALAEFEQRYCVADWCREQMLLRMTREGE